MGIWFQFRFFIIIIILFLGGCVSETPRQSGNTDNTVSNYLRLAQGYMSEGLVEKAFKPIQRALEIQPRSAQAHGVLALVYQVQGENALAMKSFKQALSYDPKASDIRNNFGAFLFQQRDYKASYDTFEQAAMDVRYPMRSRAYENMGIVSKQMNNFTLAKENFEKALTLNTSLPRSRLGLAEIYYEEGKYAESWKNYEIYGNLAKQTAASLFLGIQLSRQLRNEGAEKRYVDQLRRLYPYSREWQSYQSSL